MAREKLLTIRDVSQYLGISEKEVIDLAEKGSLPAYKIGGEYVRFKRDQVDEFRRSSHAGHAGVRGPSHYPLRERISDFLYYYDFYLFATLVIGIMLVIIFRG